MTINRNELMNRDDASLNVDELRSKYAPPGDGWTFISNIETDTVYRRSVAIPLPPGVSPQFILRMNLTIARGVKDQLIRETENGLLVITTGKECALGDYAFDYQTRERVLQAALYVRELDQDQLNQYRLERD